MSGLFATGAGSAQTGAGGYFPLAGWPGTDHPPSSALPMATPKINPVNSTYMPRTSPSRSAETGTVAPKEKVPSLPERRPVSRRPKLLITEEDYAPTPERNPMFEATPLEKKTAKRIRDRGWSAIYEED